MRKKVVVSVYREYLINDVEQRITESRLVGWLVGVPRATVCELTNNFNKEKNYQCSLIYFNRLVVKDVTNITIHRS